MLKKYLSYLIVTLTFGFLLFTDPAFASRFEEVHVYNLNVREVAGESVYNGTWTRRPGTDIFDAVWNESIRDLIEIESVRGNRIVFYRYGNNGRYSGKFSENGYLITGTASWYAPGWYWEAWVTE
jgi:hypothetical protein